MTYIGTGTASKWIPFCRTNPGSGSKWIKEPEPHQNGSKDPGTVSKWNGS